MLIRPFLILLIGLYVSVTLLIFAAMAWGRAFPSPMLAYIAQPNGINVLRVHDLRSGRQLNLGAADLDFPVWSTDGYLAFVSYRDTNPEVYIWDGVRLTNISQNSGYDRSPTWSADGRLAFVSVQEGGSEIYVWDGATLTNVSQNMAYDYYPVWNPDGRLAFISHRNGGVGIYVWDGISIAPFFLGTGVISDSWVWGADSRTAFTGARDDGDPEIFVWDGTTLTNVSNHIGIDISPVWSADGRLAFISDRDGNSEIYVWDGTTLTNVSNHAEGDSYPGWSADGRLVFTSRREGNWEIYMWDGTTFTNLSHSPTSHDSLPALWTP